MNNNMNTDPDEKTSPTKTIKTTKDTVPADQRY
jgi:hypothetical protein